VGTGAEPRKDPDATLRDRFATSGPHTLSRSLVRSPDKGDQRGSWTVLLDHLGRESGDTWPRICSSSPRSPPRYDALPVGTLPQADGGPLLNFMLQALPGEVTGVTVVRVQLLGDRGDVIFTGQEGALRWLLIEQKVPLLACAGCRVGGWPLPRAGRYTFRLLVNSQPLDGGADLFATMGSEPPPVPPDVPADGLVLVWSHLLEKIHTTPVATLQGIWEGLAVAPGAPATLNGAYTAEIVAGSQSKPRLPGTC
jgi:hypothetical protein